MKTSSSRLFWGHININVTDLEASIAFYGKLGFREFLPGIPYLNLNRAERAQIPDSATEALDLPVGKSGRACILELGDGFPKLDLTELHGPSNRPPLANDDVGMVRLCLASGDLQADYTRLQEQGVTFISQPLPTQDGRADIAVCVDPDGCLIELIQVHLENW